MKLDVFNADWEDLENLPKKQKIKKKKKDQDADKDSKSKKTDTYKKLRRINNENI